MTNYTKTAVSVCTAVHCRTFVNILLVSLGSSEGVWKSVSFLSFFFLKLNGLMLAAPFLLWNFLDRHTYHAWEKKKKNIIWGDHCLLGCYDNRRSRAADWIYWALSLAGSAIPWSGLIFTITKVSLYHLQSPSSHQIEDTAGKQHYAALPGQLLGDLFTFQFPRVSPSHVSCFIFCLKVKKGFLIKRTKCYSGDYS